MHGTTSRAAHQPSAKTADSVGAVTGVTFNVQRFSTEDGPDIRTTVFMKGCPLSYAWCHNPEGLRPQVEEVYAGGPPSPGKRVA